MMVMLLVGMASGEPSAFDGLYLKEYDPNRDGVSPDGRVMQAHIVATADKAEAIQFADVAALHEMWTRVNQREPVRPDGKPNRPLTAFTIEAVS